jgi:DNA-binding NarL/FixJ family response regulator
MHNNLPDRTSGPAVLLVDDDAFNREGMRLYLEQEGYTILETGDAATAWRTLAVSEGDVPAADAAVIDISLPAEPGLKAQPAYSAGIQLAGRIKEVYPAFGIVLFSAYEDRGAEVLNLIQAGRRGLAYKLKGCQPAALLAALRGVMAGQVIIDSDVTNIHSLADRLVARLTPEERPYVETAVSLLSQLTPREREVAERLAAAHSNEGIAHTLAIEPKSVENNTIPSRKCGPWRPSAACPRPAAARARTSVSSPMATIGAFWRGTRPRRCGLAPS